jgi:hypothetical protein
LIDRDDAAGRADAARGGNRGVTNSRCEVGHAMTGAHGGEFDQAVADVLRGALESAPPSLPSRGRGVPIDPLLLLELADRLILIAHDIISC